MAIDETVDLAIIGAGAVGLGTALFGLEEFNSVVVLDKGQAGAVQSTHNSGVIHAGIYFPADTLRAKLAREGNPMLYEFARSHAIPVANVGKYVVAANPSELDQLEFLYNRAKECGVEVERVRGADIREPNVEAIGALYFQSTGVIDPGWLIRGLAKEIRRSGGDIREQSAVLCIEPGDVARVHYKAEDGVHDLKARKLVISAGLDSDALGKMVEPDNEYTTLTSMGEFYVFNSKSRGDLNYNHTNVYPVPEVIYRNENPDVYPGVHLTPFFDASGNLSDEVLVGPLFAPCERDYAPVEHTPPEAFVDRVSGFFPSLRPGDLRFGYTGMMADIGYRDFVIRQAPAHANIISHYGMASPALTASLAIGKHTVEELMETK